MPHATPCGAQGACAERKASAYMYLSLRTATGRPSVEGRSPFSTSCMNSLCTCIVRNGNLRFFYFFVVFGVLCGVCVFGCVLCCLFLCVLCGCVLCVLCVVWCVCFWLCFVCCVCCVLCVFLVMCFVLFFSAFFFAFLLSSLLFFSFICVFFFVTCWHVFFSFLLTCEHSTSWALGVQGACPLV